MYAIGSATRKLLAFFSLIAFVALTAWAWQVQGYESPIGNPMGLFENAQQIRTELDVQNTVLLERSREMDGFDE